MRVWDLTAGSEWGLEVIQPCGAGTGATGADLAAAVDVGGLGESGGRSARGLSAGDGVCGGCGGVHGVLPE